MTWMIAEEDNYVGIRVSVSICDYVSTLCDAVPLAAAKLLGKH